MSWTKTPPNKPGIYKAVWTTYLGNKVTRRIHIVEITQQDIDIGFFLYRASPRLLAGDADIYWNDEPEDLTAVPKGCWWDFQPCVSD